MSKFQPHLRLLLDEVPRDDGHPDHPYGYRISVGQQEVHLTGVQLGMLTAEIAVMMRWTIQSKESADV